MRSVLILTLSCLARAAFCAEITYEGVAYDLETGEKLYTEAHRVTDTAEGRVLETRYLDPEGNTFARRVARFDERPFAPRFSFEDSRFGYVEGAEWTTDGARVFKRTENDQDAAIVEPGDQPFVIDAGFDRLIADRWDDLQAGKTVRFDFLNASRLDSIPFRVRLLENLQTPHGPVSAFEMTLSNPMLRWLIDDIVVSYRDSDKSLYAYRGVSNIKEPDGDDNYLVRIEYPPESYHRTDGADAPRIAAH